MRKVMGAFVILGAAIYACLPKTYSASAHLAGDVELSLSLRPLFG